MTPITLVCGMSGGGTRLGVQLCSDLGIDFGARLDYSGEDSVLKWPIVEAAAEQGWENCEKAYEHVKRVIDRFDFPTTDRATGFKTPAQTSVLPLMHKLFPDMRVIYIARHPVPLCAKERPFRTLRKKGKCDQANPHRTTAEEYKKVHERAVAYLNEKQIPWHLVRVEDLAIDLPAEEQRLAQFLGVFPLQSTVKVDLKRLQENAKKVKGPVEREIWERAGETAESLFHYTQKSYKLGADDARDTTDLRGV